MYTLKLPSNFVAHPTFNVSKFKLFISDDQKPNWKQKARPKVDAIEHMLVVEIEGTFRARQICVKRKEYLVKYKSCHHKEAIWMKFVHLEHLLEMVNKFE